MYQFLISIILLLLSACGNLGHNRIAIGEVPVSGGVKGDEIWKEPLIFKRYSWYHGLDLYYDALVYAVEPQSKFIKWFSASSAKMATTKCKPLVVAVLYSADPRKIAHSSFNSQMEANGYVSVVINDFANALANHEEFNYWKLQRYKIMGFCRENANGSDVINFTFPSFKSVEVDFNNS